MRRKKNVNPGSGGKDESGHSQKSKPDGQLEIRLSGCPGRDMKAPVFLVQLRNLADRLDQAVEKILRD